MYFNTIYKFQDLSFLRYLRHTVKETCGQVSMKHKLLDITFFHLDYFTQWYFILHKNMFVVLNMSFYKTRGSGG